MYRFSHLISLSFTVMDIACPILTTYVHDYSTGCTRSDGCLCFLTFNLVSINEICFIDVQEDVVTFHETVNYSMTDDNIIMY